MKKLTEFSQYLIDESAPLLNAMEKLNQATYKSLFVLKDGRLVAALTDGDIRRWVLKSGDLNAPVSKFANYTPKSVLADRSEEAKAIFKKYLISALPVVDADGKMIALLAPNDVAKYKKLDVPVVIMAGGAGTRLYPYTKILPKPLIPIGDVPIIERIIDFFYIQGCHRFYMIVNHKKNMIKAYFNEIEHPHYELTFIDEDIPLGTGGGLSLLKGMLNESFILTNCDNIINVEFANAMKLHKDAGNAVTVLASVQKVVIPYGVLHVGEDGRLERMEEKPVLPHLINTGCYLVSPEVIESLTVNERIDFPTVITNQMEQGKTVGIYPINSEDFLDMGQFDQMERMKHVLHIED